MLKNQAYLCSKLCSQNQYYAHKLSALLEYFELSGCSNRENDCSIRVFQFFVHIAHIQPRNGNKNNFHAEITD